MKLKDLLEQYGEYEIYPDSPKHIENAFKDLDSKGDGVLCLYAKKPKQKSVWDLEYGDKFISINAFGDITENCIWEDTVFDEEMRIVGNIFLSKEEAEREVERRKVETLLLKYGGRRWFKNGVDNWLIVLWKDGLTWSIHNKPIQGVIYFDNQYCAEKAISEIGEERLKKALFEVR